MLDIWIRAFEEIEYFKRFFRISVFAHYDEINVFFDESLIQFGESTLEFF